MSLKPLFCPLASFWAATNTQGCSCLPSSRLSRGPGIIHAAFPEPSGLSEFAVSKGRRLLPSGGCPGCGVSCLQMPGLPLVYLLQSLCTIEEVGYILKWTLSRNLTGVSEGAWPTQEMGMGPILFYSVCCRRKTVNPGIFLLRGSG